MFPIFFIKKKINIAKILVEYGININIEMILQNINIPNHLIESCVKSLINIHNYNQNYLLEQVNLFIQNNGEQFNDHQNKFLYLINILSNYQHN